MLIKPKIKDYICLNADPDGCGKNVAAQISYIRTLGNTAGPKNVLIIGASGGYGLASRIAVAYGSGSATIGIMLERPETSSKTGSAGWYNTIAFEKSAKADGYYAKTINGDAFSAEIKRETIALIKKDLKKIDMIIYSMAAPKRTLQDGFTYHSALKTIGEEHRSKNLLLKNNTITETLIKPASQDEIDSTIKVMGGEDWEAWIDALSDAEVLEPNAVTIAYSYIGPSLTYPIYKDGTIGAAKNHLHDTALRLNSKYDEQELKAFISVNKAIVTQASCAIPVVPLYLSILYKIMKHKQIHESCIQQMARLFFKKLNLQTVSQNNTVIRLDDWELREDVQKEVLDTWHMIDTENLQDLSDLDGYWSDFYKIYGFNYAEHKL